MVDIREIDTKDTTASIEDYWLFYYRDQVCKIAYDKACWKETNFELAKAHEEGNEKKINQLTKKLANIRNQYKEAVEQFEIIENLQKMMTLKQYSKKKVKVPCMDNNACKEEECIVFTGTGYIFTPTSDNEAFYKDVKLIKE